MMIKTLVLGLAISLSQFLSGAEVTVPLKPVQSDSNGDSFKRVGFETSREAEIPFATTSGKLRLKYVGSKLHVDVNDDGVFDDKDGGAVSSQQTFTVPITVKGLTLNYQIQYAAGNKRTLFLAGQTRLSGTFRKQTFELIDGDLNGRFSDEGLDMIRFEKGTTTIPLSSYVSMGNAIWSWSMPKDKAVLVLKPYLGPTGTLTLACDHKDWCASLLLIKDDGGFSTLATNSQPAPLIPGNYHVGESACSKGQGKGVPRLQGWSEKEVTIAKGANTLAYGPPFKMTITASKDKDDPRKITIQEVKLIDSGGFIYDADASGTKSTLRSFLEAGKKRTFMSTLEYG